VKKRRKRSRLDEIEIAEFEAIGAATMQMRAAIETLREIDPTLPAFALRGFLEQELKKKPDETSH
jgi:hypothetical protein